MDLDDSRMVAPIDTHLDCGSEFQSVVDQILNGTHELIRFTIYVQMRYAAVMNAMPHIRETIADGLNERWQIGLDIGARLMLATQERQGRLHQILHAPEIAQDMRTQLLVRDIFRA